MDKAASNQNMSNQAWQELTLECFCGYAAEDPPSAQDSIESIKCKADLHAHITTTDDGTEAAFFKVSNNLAPWLSSVVISHQYCAAQLDMHDLL